MDVVSAVTDRDPADGAVGLADRRETGPVHNVFSDLRPFSIGQRPVFRGGADRAVPNRPIKTTRAESSMRLLQQSAEPPEITVPIGAQRRLQLSWIPPSHNQVRIGVLLPAPGAE